MDFCANSDQQIQEMLGTLGINSIEDLFKDIDPDLIVPRLKEDDGLSEYELTLHIEKVAKKNRLVESYLGAGAYDHYVPAIVDHICSKSEFLTAYTPYQAEMSQGELQATFEFQSLVAELTQMDVANASVYDGASSCAEAALMALRIQKDRKKLMLAANVHPNYQKVVTQYLAHHEVEIIPIPFLKTGAIDLNFLQKNCTKDVCAVLIQSPNFFGIIEEALEIHAVAHQVGALAILCANPLSYGIYASAGELNADIAVGDIQPFGISLQCGGPYAGYMATKEAFLHQMPGRIVGETKDQEGKRGYVLTLQAREQHIRGEKATSNICTNQALMAIKATVAMSWYGKQGVPKIALTNFQRANYLKDQLKPFLCFDGPIFNEFVVALNAPVSSVVEKFKKEGIEPGIDLGRFYPELNNHLLITVTELKSKEILDRYADIATNAF